MSEHNEILLGRDTEAIQIPAGLKTTIPADTRVIITQNLGGSYTIASLAPVGMASLVSYLTARTFMPLQRLTATIFLRPSP